MMKIVMNLLVIGDDVHSFHESLVVSVFSLMING